MAANVQQFKRITENDNKKTTFLNIFEYCCDLKFLQN